MRIALRALKFLPKRHHHEPAPDAIVVALDYRPVVRPYPDREAWIEREELTIEWPCRDGLAASQRLHRLFVELHPAGQFIDRHQPRTLQHGNVTPRTMIISAPRSEQGMGSHPAIPTGNPVDDVTEDRLAVGPKADAKNDNLLGIQAGERVSQ